MTRTVSPTPHLDLWLLFSTVPCSCLGSHSARSPGETMFNPFYLFDFYLNDGDLMSIFRLKTPANQAHMSTYPHNST